MNSSPEVTNNTLAKLVVNDSIRAAYTDPRLAKGATIEDIKDMLDSPFADAAVQSVLATYAASEFAAISIGRPEQLGLDSNLSQGQRTNLTALGLKFELKTELGKFLDLSTAEQQDYVTSLVVKTVS